MSKLNLAIGQKDKQAATSAFKDLQSLIMEIGASYDLRIVSAPGKQSGVFRIPDQNSRRKNYYIIVEAIDRAGRPVNISITSEEDGKTNRVSTWGIRVEPTIFEKVKQDKLDDGIVQKNQFGSKQLGALKPNYQFATNGGAILKW